MKIRLTERQYKRILTEDNNLKVTRPIRKMFELLHRNWDKLSLKKIDDVLKMISEYLGVTEDVSYMIYKNFMSYGLGLVEGDPLQHYEMSVYTIKTTMPTVVTTRTYLSGFVEVKGTSEENAINRVLDGKYIDMYLDEDSMEYQNPDLDFDLSSDDVEIIDRMVLDHVEDVDWTDQYEIESRVKLKK
jgi:hypothetical protein